MVIMHIHQETTIHPRLKHLVIARITGDSNLIHISQNVDDQLILRKQKEQILIRDSHIMWAIDNR